MKKFNNFHIFAISIFILLGTLLVYKGIYPNPRNWYDHYLHLAHSFQNRQVDVPSLPDYYHDVVKLAGKNYLPFPPMPSIILLPFLTLFANISQQQVSIILGSVNALLIFLLLKKLKNPRQATILTIFFAFGTVHFWSSIVGTTWYFAHTVAVFFLTLSLLAHFYKKHYLSGLLLCCATLSRYPMLLGSVFFLFELRHDRRNLFKFLLGLAPIFPIQLIYNFVRFHDFFNMGYTQVYESYVKGNYAYNILRVIAPNLPHTGYLDPLNIPLHLFTFILMPPIVSEMLLITPSPYGLGIIFSSPLLLLTLFPPFKTKLEKHAFFGALAIALVVFMHYAQGWVQFGYRFVLDFLPFLMIILVVKFKPSKLSYLLIIVSILVNFWGVKEGIRLGW